MTQVKLRGGMPGRPLALHAAGPYSRATCTVGRHVVDPHHRRARPPGPRGRGQRALQPVVHAGRRPAPSAPPAASTPEEALAAGADQHPGAAGSCAASTSSARWCSSERLCAVVLPKPMPGSTQTSPTPAARARRGPLQHEAVHLGHHVVVAGVGLHGARRRPACAWPPSPAPRPAATSHSEAEMSLTRVAPAATAARATSGLTVSTDSRAPRRRGQGLDHRHDPAPAPRLGATGSAPGRDDSPPTSTTSAPSATMLEPVRHRAPRWWRRGRRRRRSRV